MTRRRRLLGATGWTLIGGVPMAWAELRTMPNGDFASVGYWPVAFLLTVLGIVLALLAEGHGVWGLGMGVGGVHGVAAAGYLIHPAIPRCGEQLFSSATCIDDEVLLPILWVSLVVTGVSVALLVWRLRSDPEAEDNTGTGAAAPGKSRPGRNRIEPRSQ